MIKIDLDYITLQFNFCINYLLSMNSSAVSYFRTLITLENEPPECTRKMSTFVDPKRVQDCMITAASQEDTFQLICSSDRADIESIVRKYIKADDLTCAYIRALKHLPRTMYRNGTIWNFRVIDQDPRCLKNFMNNCTQWELGCILGHLDYRSRESLVFGLAGIELFD